MKNFVVGILSFFENDLKLFKITAENEYEAAKKGLIEFTDEEFKVSETTFQQADNYPKDYETLIDFYHNADHVINVIEI